MTFDELEFAKAIDAYKRKKQRPFPTWSEVLKIVKSLGYRKDEPIPDTPAILEDANKTTDLPTEKEPSLFD